MKKLINDPARVVPEMLEGLVALAPGLALLAGENVVVRRERAEGAVALVSGGGAGHEPAHAGYVGPGLLSAAVAGDVFTSPSTDAVLGAFRAVGGPAGVLLIVKNYTGDRLNFGLAAEMARAEGIPVEVVTVADDVALGAGETAGRRGLAGTVLVHKVAGAAAAAGLPLAAVKREAEDAIAALGTMGVALTPCTVPAAGEPGFTLGPDEIELGLGIHGEAGVRRTRIASADALADEILGRIVADLGIGAGERVALLVNNLGGTPAMELAIVARGAVLNLGERGIAVERAWCGGFLTALEMAGCSISLLRLDDARLARLDAPAQAPAWVAGTGPARADRARIAPPAAAGAERARGPGAAPALAAVLRAVGAALTGAEDRLTAMDRTVGDGDLGISLARGAAAMLAEIPTLPADAPGALRVLSVALRRAMGGTSGPLYAMFLLRAAGALAEAGAVTDARAWSNAFSAGCEGVAALGGARPGERTMLDALVPASDVLGAALAAGRPLPDALRAAVDAAREGAARTAAMQPRRGRSSYLGERAIGHPDPGAEAVVVWLGAIAATVRS